ncbi:phosphotransferase family protein [Spongiibacter sp. KMU-166]|uniref:Phosphotransferase family protein n=1 Tax=Spongiibacter thalassae TaxID=2721624 RepID=A0ABX1GAB5_9GAMM|nr:phosphotransferase family protein [Spongiibacter thalassae]NKI16099.1 phosphotransferase family protein [Spongiibacter thalassae]
MTTLSVASNYVAGRDIEPGVVAMLEQAARNKGEPAYRSVTAAEMGPKLEAFLARNGVAQPRVEGLRRMGGGASKEQFVFDLHAAGQPTQRCVLRMDPLESAVVSDRRKEVSVLRRMESVLPVPPALWADVDGSELGRPALIAGFIGGVTKPSGDSGNVSGLGTLVPEAFREKLSAQFIDYLAAMHGVPVDFDPEVFHVPDADPKQAARWQVNWWSSVWRDDAIEGSPLMGLAERWLRDHLPDTDELVVVHADFRTGNYLFDEDSQEITTILDWELAHIGDYHEDLAWIICHKGVTAEGEIMASGLLTPEQLCDCYHRATGRRVNPAHLHFYKVLSVYKCVAICLATSAQTAKRQHSHQDILLSWLTAAGHAFSDELLSLLEESPL